MYNNYLLVRPGQVITGGEVLSGEVIKAEEGAAIGKTVAFPVSKAFLLKYGSGEYYLVNMADVAAYVG